MHGKAHFECEGVVAGTEGQGRGARGFEGGLRGSGSEREDGGDKGGA